MGKSKLGEYAKSLTGKKDPRKKADPIMERINGLAKTYGISVRVMMEVFGKSESTARAKMNRSGGDWTVAEICAFARRAGVEPAEIWGEVKSGSY